MGLEPPSGSTSGMLWARGAAPLTVESQPICLADCCHFMMSKDWLFLCAWP